MPKRASYGIPLLCQGYQRKYKKHLLRQARLSRYSVHAISKHRSVWCNKAIRKKNCFNESEARSSSKVNVYYVKRKTWSFAKQGFCSTVSRETAFLWCPRKGVEWRYTLNHRLERYYFYKSVLQVSQVILLTLFCLQKLLFFLREMARWIIFNRGTPWQFEETLVEHQATHCWGKWQLHKFKHLPQKNIAKFIKMYFTSGWKWHRTWHVVKVESGGQNMSCCGG